MSSPGSLASLAVLCMAWMLVLTSWTNGGGSAIAEASTLVRFETETFVSLCTPYHEAAFLLDVWWIGAL